VILRRRLRSDKPARPRAGGASRPRRAVEAAVGPWLVSRLLVVTTLVYVRFAVRATHPSAPAALERSHQGLLSWQAATVADLVAHGWAKEGAAGLGVFPLFPLLARWGGDLIGTGPGASAIGLANVAAFAAFALVFAAGLEWTGDERLARRSAWLAALAPSAFVLAMGEGAALLLALGAGALVALRRHEWAVVALLGALSGLAGPFGVLLVVPVALEAAPAWRGEDRRLRTVVATAGATVAPLLGAGGYLAWAAATIGRGLAPWADAFSPLRHGRFVDPVATFVTDVSDLVHGRHIVTGLDALWAVLLVALAAVALRRLPGPLGALGALGTLVALLGADWSSLATDGLVTAPLLLAAASLLRSERVERGVLAVVSAGMVGAASLAFLGLLAP